MTRESSPDRMVDRAVLIKATRTGYGTHGDYMFGWEGDSLQTAMDSDCYVNCPSLTTQSIAQGNQCSKPPVVNEDVSGCKSWALSTSNEIILC